MSFVRLDNGEFPPLNKINQASDCLRQPGSPTSLPKTSDIKYELNGSKMDCLDSEFSEDINYRSYVNSINKQQAKMSNSTDYFCPEEKILSGIDFVKCRVGLRLCDYNEDLENSIRSNIIGKFGDFILAPIEPIRQQFYCDEDLNFEAIPDLVLPSEIWQSRVAVDLGLRSIDSYDLRITKQYDRIFRHAIYLSSPVVTVACPETEIGIVSVASVINDRLAETKTTPLLLIKVPLKQKTPRANSKDWILNQSPLSSINSGSKSIPPTPSSSSSQTHSYRSPDSFDRDVSAAQDDVDSTNELLEGTKWCVESGYGQSSGGSQESGLDCKNNRSSWRNWNDLRSHLRPDIRIGVCLIINDDLVANDEELSVWTGEPIRMIIIPTHRFVQSYGPNSYLQLNIRLRSFIRQIMVANSLKTSLVLEGKPDEKMRGYLIYLKYIVSTIKKDYVDYLLDWNDRIQPPLQPLSSNLDSNTYGVFEMDSMKYRKYRDAMVEALNSLICRHESEGLEKDSHVFILMVLGAGRGPLVDSFINAIKTVNTNYRFKIYALDKNPSSVTSLRYKQKNSWINSSQYEVEVVEADMRYWNPGVKADIIATELLGSLSDNELSPECIDGVWRFATPSTISIPQNYSSYVAPISSYKIHQELHNIRNIERHPFDQIYVVKLSNCYHINGPQQLFKFEHKNLSLNPNQRCNERYKVLTFWSKVDTICHGFAGYFFSNLYGSVTLSTLKDKRTPNMDSWFPAFIPLEQPVQMPKGARLDVHFWRKESASMVWYQWVVTAPERSRIHSPNGLNSGMSKFT